MLRHVSILLLCMMLLSCGYHLVGAGDDRGAVPDDVETLSLLAVGEPSQSFVRALQHYLQLESKYRVLAAAEEESDRSRHVVLRVEAASERFIPTVFDLAGVATQYRLTIQAKLNLMRDDHSIWRSGRISVADDLIATGTLASIESSRSRLRQSLRKSWVRKAVSRLRSGF